jgi:hypothetical protein
MVITPKEVEEALFILVVAWYQCMSQEEANHCFQRLSLKAAELFREEEIFLIIRHR